MAGKPRDIMMRWNWTEDSLLYGVYAYLSRDVGILEMLAKLGCNTTGNVQHVLTRTVLLH